MVDVVSVTGVLLMVVEEGERVFLFLFSPFFVGLFL